MGSLTSRQKKYLKSLAHHLEPTVRVGRARVAPAVIKEVTRTIASHELIKIRIEADAGADRREIATTLASQIEADLVGTIGKIAILYKPHPEKPRIRFPKDI